MLTDSVPFQHSGQLPAAVPQEVLLLGRDVPGLPRVLLLQGAAGSRQTEQRDHGGGYQHSHKTLTSAHQAIFGCIFYQFPPPRTQYLCPAKSYLFTAFIFYIMC